MHLPDKPTRYHIPIRLLEVDDAASRTRSRVGTVLDPFSTRSWYQELSHTPALELGSHVA